MHDISNHSGYGEPGPHSATEDIVPGISGACQELDLKPGTLLFVPSPSGLRRYTCPEASTHRASIMDSEGLRLPLSLADQVQVLSCGLDLEFEVAVVKHLRALGPTNFDNMVYLRYRAEGEEYRSVVPMATPFLTQAGTLVPASRLQMSDELIDLSGEPVSILEVSWGAYEGSRYELATTLEVPNDLLDGHLVVMDGVLRCDYAVELYHPLLVDPEHGTLHPDLDNRPCVGSLEWDAVNGHPSRGRNRHSWLSLDEGIFKPASFLTTDIPQTASAAISRATGRRRPMEDMHAAPENQGILDAARHALEFELGPHYPNINFVLDWYAVEDNVYAWTDEYDLVTVVVTGAFVRRNGIDLCTQVHKKMRSLG